MWRYIVDALIVGALAYQLLRLIRRRRAGQILLGLLLIAAASFAADYVQLPLLGFVLRPLTPYWGIAVIVLFQGEIRRGLAMLGGWTLWSGRPRRSSPYEDVVLAVVKFAQDQTGALIVLERKTGLRTHAESGVSLDARLSYDLLLNIFRAGSRFHDGAVIVMKDRIAAASCFLPLSVSPERTRELGSRHRAAIGITEETDAVALVVAEHSGVISLAVEGALETGLSEDALRQRIAQLFGKRVVSQTACIAIPAPVAAPVLPPANNVSVIRRRDGA